MIERVDGGPIDRNLAELDVANTRVGMIVLWPGAVEPGGWVRCDGSHYDRRRLPELFGVIGTTFGSSGGDDFQVPSIASIGSCRYLIRV